MNALIWLLTSNCTHQMKKSCRVRQAIAAVSLTKTNP
jgi:hypothetical protein